MVYYIAYSVMIFMEYLLYSDGTQENLASCFDRRMNHFDNFGKL